MMMMMMMTQFSGNGPTGSNQLITDAYLEF